MAFTRTTTINSAPGGDSVKQAVLDLDTDLTGAFGHLNTLDSTKAPIAKGVTNGDTHDHSGGDGAQIAYSGLSGLPALGSMAAQNTSTYAGPGSSQAFTVGAFTQTGNALLAQTTGNVLIGTTTNDGVNKLQVNGGGYFGYPGEVQVKVHHTSANKILSLGADGTTSYLLSNNGITFYVNNAASQMILDSSGNLLVGTSTASGKVTVAGSGWSHFQSNAASSSPSATEPYGLWLGSNRSNADTEGNIAYRNYLTFASWDGTTYSETARIDSSGNLLVGYTSSNGSYKLQVNSQIFATSSTIATSDVRYKTDIQTITDGLAIIHKLRPVQFNWKEHPVHAFDRTHPTTGFIAQETLEALSGKPYAASIVKSNDCKLPDGTTEEFLGIAEGNLISIIVSAIQELSAKVTTLEEQLNAA